MVSITLIGKAEALKMAQALKMTEFYDRFESHVCTTSAGDFKVIQSAALNNQQEGQEMAVLFLHGYPQTHAIAAFQAQTATGKLKAEIIPTTPRG